jgi:hypothetical protein
MNIFMTIKHSVIYPTYPQVLKVSGPTRTFSSHFLQSVVTPNTSSRSPLCWLFNFFFLFSSGVRLIIVRGGVGDSLNLPFLLTLRPPTGLSKFSPPKCHRVPRSVIEYHKFTKSLKIIPLRYCKINWTKIERSILVRSNTIYFSVLGISTVSHVVIKINYRRILPDSILRFPQNPL